MIVVRVRTLVMTFVRSRSSLDPGTRAGLVHRRSADLGCTDRGVDNGQLTSVDRV